MSRSADTHAYLTPPEIARLLRVSESKILLWIRAGRLSAVNVSEGQRPKFRVRREDLDQFLAGRVVTPQIRQASRKSRLEIPHYV